MREILFRGKRVDNGEWIYGDIIQFLMYGIVRIIEQEPNDGKSYGDSEVDSETVGQYIGLTDKNGRKIFEGDIVKYKEHILQVEYDEEYASVFFHNNDLVIGECIARRVKEYADVIGNIHDNPELITCGANSEK